MYPDEYEETEAFPGGEECIYDNPIDNQAMYDEEAPPNYNYDGYYNTEQHYAYPSQIPHKKHDSTTKYLLVMIAALGLAIYFSMFRTEAASLMRGMQDLALRNQENQLNDHTKNKNELTKKMTSNYHAFSENVIKKSKPSVGMNSAGDFVFMSGNNTAEDLELHCKIIGELKKDELETKSKIEQRRSDNFKYIADKAVKDLKGVSAEAKNNINNHFKNTEKVLANEFNNYSSTADNSLKKLEGINDTLKKKSELESKMICEKYQY